MPKVLIVDDDKDISELISLILKRDHIYSLEVNDSTKVSGLITKEQFDIEPNYNDYVLINRNDMLNEDTKMRYESLKMKMEHIYEQD